MIDFNFNNDCSGCGGCYNICPVNAIRMLPDMEGFLIPVVDKAVCLNCGKCDTVCPHLNRKKIEGNNVEAVWLYASCDDEAKLKSSSGAACFELGKRMIANKGYVAGCVWDKNLVAIHEIGNTEDILTNTQGSKYVQSNTEDIYQRVLGQLKKESMVLFTGTPCQATAMHNVVLQSGSAKYRENLITVGVLCHGVASPKVWESYKKYTEKREGSPLVAVNFRDKSKEGYKKSYCNYEYADGHSIYLPTFLPSSKYIEATLVYNLAIRNNCTHCDCKGVNMGVDLVVGDWYAEYKGEGELGTNCIIAFTKRGKRFAEESLDGLRIFEYESIQKNNAFIAESVKASPNREKFFERIEDYDYWDKVEELYPPIYKYKKLLVRLGVFDSIKRLLG